ncbi:MAG TPA: enolase C-terminal domain-like protein [Acidothermaceae bacterium]
MTNRITGFHTADVRFPTSRHRDGSDALNPFPDYSAAYLQIETSEGDRGFGFAFTVGRGNEVQLAAIEALRPMVVGRDVEELIADLGAVSVSLVGDSQLRWLGPAKGVIHMAASAVLNSLWDLKARRAGLPLWRLLAELPAAELVKAIDFRYLRDALTPAEALDILERGEDGKADRVGNLLASGFPAYTTTPGWLGYDDEKLARLSAEAKRDGFGMIKLKVGLDLDEDRRRLGIARAAVGDLPIGIDANQAWGVGEAIEWVNGLREYEPYWIEEPTSPDDILGHAAVRRAVSPIRVATGEHVHNAVMFKQLLQAEAVDVIQIDACRVGGVNENLAILLMATKFGVAVCPHAGGVGLCELVQHLSMFDYVAVSGTTEGRMVEYVDHLHEHFVDPVVIRNGRYVAPTTPGIGAQLRPESVAEHLYPSGPAWATPPAAREGSAALIGG